jgi:mevalonate kinase
LTEPFETRVPGKWVLAGEHAVLRGQPAVALPHPELALSLRFTPEPGRPLEVRGALAEPARELLAAHGRELFARGPHEGTMVLESSVPAGAGLGSSAALCVALVRWARPELEAPLQRELARRLEDRFHGTSSGMDIAAVASAGPILFRRDGITELGPKPAPAARFSFHDTGVRCSTRECVAQVQAQLEAEPSRARELDQRMGQAALNAWEALRIFDRDPAGSLAGISAAMTESQHCFRAWGLVPPAAEAIERQLLAQGALAAKLTGAGRGGFVVALWGPGAGPVPSGLDGSGTVTL